MWTVTFRLIVVSIIAIAKSKVKYDLHMEIKRKTFEFQRKRRTQEEYLTTERTSKPTSKEILLNS